MEVESKYKVKEADDILNIKADNFHCLSKAGAKYLKECEIRQW